MGISEIRARSNKFVANLDMYIEDAITEVGEELTQINRDQMLDSLQPSGKPIFPFYSDKYAKRKGFPYPNLYVNGNYQADMFITVDKSEFFFTSSHRLNEFIPERYEKNGNKIFGIPKKREPEAQKIATSSLARIYNREVLNG